MGSWSRRGRGGLIGSPACPWGQREGPAQLGVPLTLLLPGPPLPSRVPGQGMSCSRRSLPGARGQGGLGGVLPSSPPHLLPAQVRAGAATTAAPDSRRPRAGAAQGVGQGEGLGVPRGERASRRHLVAVPRASAPGGHLAFVTSTTQLASWAPLPRRAHNSWGPLGKRAAELWERDAFPRVFASQAPFRSGRITLSLFYEIESTPFCT